MITRVSLQRRISAHLLRKRCTIVALFLVIVIVLFSMSSLAISIRSAGATMVRQSLASTRLTHRLHLHPGIDMSKALEERRELLERTIKVQWTEETLSGAVLGSMDIALRDYPSWIDFREGVDGSMHAVLSEVQIAAKLQSLDISPLSPTRSCSFLSEYQDENGITRAKTDCVARVGYSIDHDVGALVLRRALTTSASGTIRIPVHHGRPTINWSVNGSEQPLILLGVGRSNFKGSGEGRKSNVRKALNERVNNVILRSGQSFSYVDVLGDAGSARDGWKTALAIFEGVNLRPIVGGGVCQGSTTVFRAALRAGLPIEEQKNHSLYVHYYEEHGVGQDATVFPGKQDFRFRNDTGHDILLQAYTEGDEAYVLLFGVDDQRVVRIAGPYFSDNAPTVTLPGNHTLTRREILWLRTTLKPTGALIVEPFVARYNALPKKLRTSIDPTTEITSNGSVYHAAAR